MNADDFAKALLLSLKQDEIMDVFAKKLCEVVQGEMIPLHSSFEGLKKEVASKDSIANLHATNADNESNET